MIGSLLYAHVVVKTKNLVISLCCFVEYGKETHGNSWCTCSTSSLPILTNISINTQVIIQNRALSLARYVGLSADNHLDGQNGCQQSFCHCKWRWFRVEMFFLSLFWNNHLCIFTKTIIRLRLSDYRWIFTSTSSRWIFTDNHFAFGE